MAAETAGFADSLSQVWWRALKDPPKNRKESSVGGSFTARHPPVLNGNLDR